MLSVARDLTETQWPGQVALILGFRAPRDLSFREQIEQLKARKPNLTVTVTMSDPGQEAWSGIRGRIGGTRLA